jgi:glucose-6-phosphate 1-dehydrogenase
MRRKVIPALFYLYQHGELPDKFRIVGFSRRDMTDAQFRAYVKEVLGTHNGKKVPARAVNAFLQLFHFHQGTFEDGESYDALKKIVARMDAEWGMCTNKLFYLAVAPEYYETIFRHLARSGLTDPCSPEEGWTRLIIEKPFGVDLKTAKSIEKVLQYLFKSEQIYRIDHYLAKEMLQNILVFRFSNNLFENHWGRDLIEKIHIRALEEIGVEKRGAFYDPVGAFRDVGQNHFLQMVALLTMEHPQNFSSEAVHEKRAEILKKLHIFTPDEVTRSTFRAQHAGYQDIAGVKSNSQTETYFRVRVTLNSPRWRDVPIVLEGGKSLGTAEKEIIITFKHPKPCLCPPQGPHHKNEVIIRFEPKEEILIEFWSKKPGFTFETAPHLFHFLLREPKAHVPYIEEYAKLLSDCIRGDQTLFVSNKEIQAMWRFTDPILDAWQKDAVPLHSYKPGTKDITQQPKLD